MVNWVHLCPRLFLMDRAEHGTMQDLLEDGKEPEEDIFPACPDDLNILTPSFPPFLATETTASVVEFYACCCFILSWLLLPTLSRRTTSPPDYG